MKKTVLMMSFLGFIFANAQTSNSEINKSNSWLKADLNLGLPVGKTADYNSFVGGLGLKGQYLVTPNFGLGLTAGYNHYFAKNGFESVGEIPVGLFARYYFENEGVFLGMDGGYGFITNSGAKGGMYIKPQIGYHNDDWNIYGYYHQNFLSSSANMSLQQIGLGVSYNIKFK